MCKASCQIGASSIQNLNQTTWSSSTRNRFTCTRLGGLLPWLVAMSDLCRHRALGMFFQRPASTNPLGTTWNPKASDLMHLPRRQESTDRNNCLVKPCKFEAFTCSLPASLSLYTPCGKITARVRKMPLPPTDRIAYEIGHHQRAGLEIGLCPCVGSSEDAPCLVHSDEHIHMEVDGTHSL